MLSHGEEREALMSTTIHTRRQFETLTAAANRTGLSVRTLRRRIAAGLLPAYRSGPRVLRVDPADVRPPDGASTYSMIQDYGAGTGYATRP